MEIVLGKCFSKNIHLARNDAEKVLDFLELKSADILKITNSSILPPIIFMLKYCEPITQLVILRMFNILTSPQTLMATQNLEKCHFCHPNVFELLLDNVFNFSAYEQVHFANIELIRNLGRHKVTVSNIKHVFKVIVEAHDKSDDNWRILDAMKA